MRSEWRLRGWVLALGLVVCAGCKERRFSEPFELAGGERVEVKTLEAGYEGYMLYCYGCHGEKGDGRGPAAATMRPAPRDFRQGLFKFSGGPAGSLPTDEALDRTLRRGLHGTPMLPWDLSKEQRADIFAYVKTFKYPGAEKNRWQEETPAEELELSKDPWTGKAPEAVARGERVYHLQVGGAGCANCHPGYLPKEELNALIVEAGGEPFTEFPEGMYGSTLRASEYARETDAAGEPLEDADGELALYKVLPPDFLFHKVKTAYPVGVRLRDAQDRKSPYTAEEQRMDLYRTIAAGIGGAAMPTWKGALPEEDLWALAYYVQSLMALRDTPEAAALRTRLEGQE